MITEKEVEHIGWLARIEINERNADTYAAQLNSVLDYFGQLDEINTGDVTPTYHVMDLSNVFREDVAAGSFVQDDVLENTEHTQEGYFKAPRIS